MSGNHIQYRSANPEPALADFVESYWMLSNTADDQQELILLPDGRVDILFTLSATVPYRVVLRGLDTTPGSNSLAPGTIIFAISFKLLAIEYLLHTSLAGAVEKALFLPADFLGITAGDLTDFDTCCKKAAGKLATMISGPAEEKKRLLFQLIYASNGAVTVKELADTVFWSSRQINRYFNQWFGISLKAYCNILRFRASFPHIKAGKLYPEANFADQAHFIRDIKKYAGVIPKELNKNKNDRFIQFLTLPEK